MLPAAKLPDNAPFPPDLISALNRVITQSSSAQRNWLSGFLAGLEAATGTPATAAPPAKRQELTILFATESGNAEALANRAKRDATKLGFAPKLLDAADATPEALAKASTLLVIASTWGEGEAPQRAAPFLKALLAPEAPRLEGVRFAVLALGDRAYTQFCETGRAIDERLAALGATRVADRIDCDLDYESPANSWLGGTLPVLRTEKPGETSVIHVDFGQPASAEYSKANPFRAEITGLVNLNSSRSAKQTLHVELSLAGSGLTYEPGDAIGIQPQNDPALAEAILDAAGLAGDATVHAALVERHDITTLTGHLVTSYANLLGDKALAAKATDKEYLAGRQVIDLLAEHPNRLSAEQLLGLLRPLPPRLYSVASSQKATPDEAHLLVGAVRYRTHGRDRAGVASTWVADRRRAGDTVPIYVKPNAHFRLPGDGTAPIIMVGPGTGVAPFRAFMQERDATEAKGRNWLFFGDQHYTHDFLYQLEWQDLLSRGVLTRLDVAFSRDQDAKRYVQHRMLAHAADLYAWLEEGAHFYVCGDQSRMARDVHAALRLIIANGAGISPEKAEERLDAMKRQGRYQLDVY